MDGDNCIIICQRGPYEAVVLDDNGEHWVGSVAAAAEIVSRFNEDYQDAHYHIEAPHGL